MNKRSMNFTIAPDARLRVGGTVDQDHKPPLLKAKTVQLVQ